MADGISPYGALRQLIHQFGTEILDSTIRCNEELQKSGIDRNSLYNQLFFLLLEKNIPLEIRKTAFKRGYASSYELSIGLYTKIFEGEKLSNEYENILIRHIQTIIEVFDDEGIINFEYVPKKHRQIQIPADSLPIDFLLESYGTTILEKTDKVRAILNDVFTTISKEERKKIVTFISSINDGSIDFSKDEDAVSFNELDSALEKYNLSYEPFSKAKEKYNAYLKIQRQKEEQREEEERQKAEIQQQRIEELHQLRKEERQREEERKKLEAQQLWWQEVSRRREEEWQQDEEKQQLEKENEQKHTVPEAVLPASVLIIVVCIIFVGIFKVYTHEEHNTNRSYLYNTKETEIKTSGSEIAKTAYVSAYALNFRQSPSAESKVIQILKKGDKVTLLDNSVIGKYANNDWVKIRANGYEGYVKAIYLSPTYIAPE